ncbi:MAG: hypothetical protein NW241_16590 [Bacteroidia bacterium]|nr:hypothetical protein [Bacteroidia bacterium]
MAGTPGFQTIFFEKLRDLIRSNVRLAQEVADVLNLSLDGAYRRIRNETPLRVDEMAILCKKFGVSVDELMLDNHQAIVTFQTSRLDESATFEDYLQQMTREISSIHQYGVNKCYFAAKDIPVHHLFQFPELVLFKMFFWQKSIFNRPQLADQRFSTAPRTDSERQCIELCRQIADKYAIIPTTEIWNDETVSSFFKQLLYYYDSGWFETREDAVRLIDAVERFFTHLQEEAKAGYKYLYDAKPQNPRIDNFDLYYNDLIVIDNIISIIFRDDSARTYLVYRSIEYMGTANQHFCKQMNSWLETQTSRSVLISRVSELQRNRFFRTIQDRVTEARRRIEQG